jgi:ParB family chromosome partitioning protein
VGEDKRKKCQSVPLFAARNAPFLHFFRPFLLFWYATLEKRTSDGPSPEKKGSSMNWMKKKKEEGAVVRIHTGSVCPNPRQPRTAFDEEALSSLAASIRRYGLLQPISVRRTEAGYELIAGERRLRAARMAGLSEIPALVYTVDGEASAELAVMENLLREDLNIFETAAAMETLSREYGLTQEEIAERLSVSQSYVANKLRLLRFDAATQAKILAAGLTERHARALLRLPEEMWERVLSRVISGRMNVAATEALVEELLNGEKGVKQKKKSNAVRGAMRDIRLFYNSVERAMEMVRRQGVAVQSRREEQEDEIRLIISIHKPLRKT